MNKVGVNFENVLTLKEELNLNLIETLSKLKSLGITSLDVKYERLTGENSYLKEILISNLNVGCVFVFCPLYNRNNLQKALKVIDFCAEYKIGEIMLITDFLPNGYGEEDVNNFKQNLRRIVKYAQNFGIVIGVENVGVSGYPVQTLKQTLDILKSVKGLNLIFDGGNYLASGEDVLLASKELAPFVQRLHLKNLKFDSGLLIPSAVGDGNIDYLSVFNEVKKFYPAVPLVIEFPFEHKSVLSLLEKSTLYVHTEMI